MDFIDKDKLQQSREFRMKYISKFGFIPQSVITVPFFKRGDKETEKSQDDIAFKKLKEKYFSGELKPTYYEDLEQSSRHLKGIGVRGKKLGLSMFPPFLAKFIVQFYSDEGDTVLDPCAGHTAAMEISYNLGRNYIGYDVNEKFMDFNRKVREKLLTKNTGFLENDCTITLHLKSSTQMLEKDNTIDMIYTSPPYWNLEYYGDSPEQLGWGKTYEEFLLGLSKILHECKRVLKPEKYCIINVNDFRKNGKFYPYHSDVIGLGKCVGFEMHDIGIVKWNATPIASAFLQQVDRIKVLPKGHEYLIIFKKCS